MCECVHALLDTVRDRENVKLETDEYNNIMSRSEKKGKYNCTPRYEPNREAVHPVPISMSNLDANHTEHLYNHRGKGKGNLVSFIFTPLLLSNRIYKGLWVLDNILTTLMHIPLAYV